jgi:CBS domain-containing protein
VSEETPLDEAVHIMEHRQVKRLPVVRDGRLVGIVSRADLLRAFASLAREMKPSPASDGSIRESLLGELERQKLAPVATLRVIVRNGVVDLWGVITDERQRLGIRVAAENTRGVKAVRDHLVRVEPISGMALPAPEDAAVPAAGDRRQTPGLPLH